ncbi:MAG: DUF4276 family protein [Bryobacterales bacterium]|nr:DUF4276 family protein [Bryobacterales bacterium]
MKVYVEGGGDHNKDLASRCRKGFSDFSRKAGYKGRMPRIVACGGRSGAYKDFCVSHKNAGTDDFPVLLVDSEAPVVEADPWEHVRLRAGDLWQRPDGVSQDQIHLMVQAMEAWFHADKESVGEYYGQGFRPKALSPPQDVESIPKVDLFDGMKRATKACSKKGEYSKGDHSFEILGRIDPEKVRASSKHAERLFEVLDRKCAPPPSHPLSGQRRP